MCEFLVQVPVVSIGNITLESFPAQNGINDSDIIGRLILARGLINSIAMVASTIFFDGANVSGISLEAFYLLEV